MEGPGRLHGREREQAALAAAVASAATGRGRVVVVQGDAGIGKSRLLADVAARAEAAGFELRAGRGDELGRGRPFGPIAQALALRPDAEAPEAARIGRLLAGADEVGHAGIPMAGEVRFRVLDTVLALVDRATAQAPLALLLDDLHWADEDSLRVVAALGERAAHLPLLLALGARRHPVAPPLATTLRVLEEQGATVVAVGPLAPAAITDVVAELLDGPPGPALLADVARAEGNPFLAMELVAAHSAAGALVADGGTVELRPGAARVSLGDAVLRRLEHLRPETVDLLRAGAVLGRSFTLPVVADLCGRRAVDMAVDVDEALAAGLLEDVGDRLVFSHDLVREGIYEDLPGAVRSALHVEAARALAANDAAAFDVATQVERTAGAVEDDVVDWLVRGAQQVRVTAPVTAAAFLRRAGEVLEPADPRWLQVQLLLAEAHVFSGNPLDGQALAEQCLDLADLPEEQRAALAHLVGQARFLLGDLGEAATRFEQSARPGHPGQAAALADGALARLLGGDLTGAVELGDRALAVARDAADVGAEVFALATSSWARALAGDLAGGLELGARAVALADSAGTLEVHRNVPWLFYAQVLLWADRDNDAAAAIARASDLGERLGLVWDVPLRHLLQARAHHRSGDWEEALAEAQAGLSQADDQGGSIGEVWLLCLLARLSVGRGELEEAERALDIAEGSASRDQGEDQIVWARALLSEARGDAETAGAFLDLLWDGVEDRGLDYYLWDIAPDVVRVALRRGDHARVARVLANVDEIAARAPDSSAPVVAARCRGLAELDPEPLLRAVGLLEVRKAGARPVERAILQTEAAAVLAHAGRNEEAAALRAAAEPVLRRAGAVTPGVPGTGTAAPEAGRGAAFGWAALTGREREVVALLAESLSNAEIAERLFCSRRTVESHLSHAYTKLGITSRVELAVEAARRFGGDP